MPSTHFVLLSFPVKCRTHDHSSLLLVLLPRLLSWDLVTLVTALPMRWANADASSNLPFRISLFFRRKIRFMSGVIIAFFLTCHSWKRRIYRLNCDATYLNSKYINTSGLGGHIAISGCQSSSQSFGNTFCELVTVENPRFAVGISTLFSIVPET